MKNQPSNRNLAVRNGSTNIPQVRPAGPLRRRRSKRFVAAIQEGRAASISAATAANRDPADRDCRQSGCNGAAEKSTGRREA